MRSRCISLCHPRLISTVFGGVSGAGEQPASDKERRIPISASGKSTSRTDLLMAELLDRWVWEKMQRRLCVERGRRAFPDRPRADEACPERPMVQARPFADVAVPITSAERSLRPGCSNVFASRVFRLRERRASLATSFPIAAYRSLATARA